MDESKGLKKNRSFGLPSAFGEGLPVPNKSMDAGLKTSGRKGLCLSSVFYCRPLLESFFISHGVELRKDLDIVPEAPGSFGYLIKGAF